MIKSLKKIIPKTIRSTVRLWFQKGTKYTCPICGFSSDSFFLVGHDSKVLKENNVVGGSRRAAGCHKCRSNDRERLMYVYLNEKTDVIANCSEIEFLHIAPEKRLSKKLIDVNFKKYVCGDLFTEGYDYPEYVINMNVLNIPFNNNTFDFLLCNHVLEHIPTDIDAMKEIYRVLKPGGKAILQVPISKTLEHTFEDFSVTDPEQRELVFGQYDHVRIYGKDYVNKLESVGFKVNIENISSEYKGAGLNPDEDLYVCIK